MSPVASVPSINPSSSLKRNSGDIGWDYGVLVDPNNLNVIKCKFCDLVVRVGIYRLKQYVGGIRGEVRPCLKAPPKAINKCKKVVDDSKQAKKARQEEKQDVRDVVILDDGPDVEDTTINREGLDDVGDSTQRKLGPMDKFTLPMDSSSLSNTKLVRQQRIPEALWKEIMHALKRYIARWVYVHDNKLVHCSITKINVVNFWRMPFHAINNEEFDQLLEAAGRFGPGGQKPNQHELREKLLYDEVEDTKKLLKLQEQEWAKNGCSIMTDAWTDQKRRSIMNMCVNCSIGITFLESNEASAESHTGEFIFHLYEKKNELRAMSQSEEWETISHVKKTPKGVQATATLVKPNFWASVALCLRVFEPLVKVLHMVDGDMKPSMAFLYGEILKAKKEIMVGLGNIDKVGTLNLYNNIIEIIDEKMKGRLNSPLHLAAYFLNPYYSYNDSSIFGEEEVMDGFFTAVETFYHAKWWENYGTQVPTLQKMAIRILSLTSSSSDCERNRSCFDGVHTRKRNRLTCERVEQLIYVRFNNLHSKKKAKAKKNNKVDPLVAANATCAQWWMVDGGDDNNSDVDAVTGLTWQQIVDTCGPEEVTKQRRSARLAQPRQIEEDVQSEPEELPNEEEEI
ncbi:unnamed protein product [Miscanthus lutarioriparius]|uniref:HAT C-terminal dimerisation domain-containing protein n=1 Tax=Miscanthus lutarioriparius TaxID=422564 RepID=A0A811PAG5_9POAL|nr:unnamed protein product [Miscanthus lutarioriparius]